MIKTRFADFVTLQRGFDLPTRERREGSFPVVASSSISGKHSEYRVEPPGVTTGRSGSLGTVLYISEPFWPLNTVLWVRDFKGNHPRYVYYYLKTLALERYNSGAGVPTLNRNHLDEIEVQIHSPDEQPAIAAALATYDGLIDINRRRIEILESMAESLFREWFVSFRYPGLADVERSESPIGLIPNAWHVSSVGEAVHLNPRVRLDATIERPFVPMESLVENSMVIRNTERRTGNSGAQFMNGDVLLARITPSLENGKTGFVQFLNDGAIGRGSTEFIVMRGKSLPGEWVYLLSRREEFRTTAIRSMVGASGRQRVQESALRPFRFPHPDEKTLADFAQRTRPLFRLVQLLVQMNESLGAIQHLLLPRLISGDLDVSKLDIDTSWLAA